VKLNLIQVHKMKSSIIFIIVFILLIVVGGVIAYFIIEKPAKQKAEKPKDYNNLSIDAFTDGKQIVANYTIFCNGSVYAKGTTLQSDYILQQVEANQTYDIMIESLEIYTKTMHMNPTMISPIRVDLESNKIGNVVMWHNGTFWQDNPINLTINISGMIKNPVLCFRWSINLIDVSIDGLNTFDGKVPKRLNVDKCYYLNSPINNTFLIFPVSYRKFGNWNGDYIKVILFDGDVTNYSPNTITYENQLGGDIFMNDITYEIKQ
jgi:preprotein translocase subunit YajC